MAAETPAAKPPSEEARAFTDEIFPDKAGYEAMRDACMEAFDRHTAELRRYLETADRQLDKIDAVLQWKGTGRGRVETATDLRRKAEALELFSRAHCPACGGAGYHVESDHDPNCGGDCCEHYGCPVPVQIQCDCDGAVTNWVEAAQRRERGEG